MDFYLQKALFYRKINIKEIDLPQKIPEKEEILLCYLLNPKQTSNIEPVHEQFLENLMFIGKNNEARDNCIEQVSLPQGHYLFVQERSDKMLSQVDWLNLAIEQHKDGLWERNKLGNIIYIRFLFEDEKTVTQIFRPVIK